MVIKYNNKEITLPDIPDEILNEYPYAVIMYKHLISEEIPYGYHLFVADNKISYIDGTIWGEPGGKYLEAGVGINFENVAGAIYQCLPTENTWTKIDDNYYYELESSYIPLKSVRIATIIWSNHDIYDIIYYPIENDNHVFGDIVFLKSDVKVEQLYTVTGGWLQNLANCARGVTGLAKQYNPIEMEKILSATSAKEVKF